MCNRRDVHTHTHTHTHTHFNTHAFTRMRVGTEICAVANVYMFSVLIHTHTSSLVASMHMSNHRDMHSHTSTHLQLFDIQYRVSKTHRIPSVAGHFSKKSH